MSQSHKPSGAQRRKRLAEVRKECEKSRHILETFFKRTKVDNAADAGTSVGDGESSQTAEALPAMPGSEEADDSNTDDDSDDNVEDEDDDVELHSDDIEMNINQTIPAVLAFHDVGYLEFDPKSQLPIISQQLRTEMVIRGSDAFQHKEGPFSGIGKRSMTKSWFTRRLAKGQGEEIPRTWLLYSPVNESAYCFCCLLFPSSSANARLSLEVAGGFTSWRKPEKVAAHEASFSHRRSFSTWKEAEYGIIQKKGIDTAVESHIQSERKRWREVLKRILDCIKFLASQNLALRGHVERLATDKSTNLGNFLSLLKLLATYDPVLFNHLEHARLNPGAVSYLSPETQNEFIGLLASTVRNKLLCDIRRNKYYGIMFDSTPDIAHREQMCEVIRFVDVDFTTKKVTIREAFLGYILIHGKDAATVEDEIVHKLNADNLPLQDCRSQCYDNAAVMSGHISGVQQRITARNHRAIFVNCDNHSLNLAGVHAASQDPVIVTFFGTVESIYCFFARSTLRWEQLKHAVTITVKRESETRWSARAEAVKAVHDGLDGIVELLETMSEDKSGTQETRAEAQKIIASILCFNFLAFLPFWHSVLAKIDRVQKRLQDPQMNFQEAFADLEALEQNISEIRDELCEESIRRATVQCNDWGVNIEKRVRRRKRMPGESARDVGLSAEDEIRRVMKCSLDTLQQEITSRFTRLKDLNSKFGFLLDVTRLLERTDTDELSDECVDLAQFYDTDIAASELYSEILDCKMLLTTRREILPKTPLELLTFIMSYGEDVFPNLRIALQILLTIAVSIASCERSFSKLKLILTYLRASMGQDRLSDLALLSVEKETVDKIDFDTVIDQFALTKARKIDL